MTYNFAGQYGPTTIINLSGTPLPNLPVNVFVVGTTTPVSLFTNRTKADGSANPTSTDANANLTFFCAPGTYDILANSLRYTVTVDPDPADVATVPGTTMTGPLVLNADPTIALGAATKEYVDNAATTGAPLGSPHFTGIPTAPTASYGTNSTQIATTSYADIDVLTEQLRAQGVEATLTPKFIIDPVATASGAIAAGHYTPVNDTGGLTAFTLPAAPADGTRCGIEYVAGGSHGIVVTAGGSDVFDVAGGSTTATLSVNVLLQSVIWTYKATGAIWYTTSNNLPLSVLDGRYVFSQSNGFTNPSVTSGTAFIPNPFGQSVVGITCTTSASIGVTFGPSTGAEHTWVPTVVAPVGAYYGIIVPINQKVVFTGTVADFTFVVATVQ